MATQRSYLSKSELYPYQDEYIQPPTQQVMTRTVIPAPSWPTLTSVAPLYDEAFNSTTATLQPTHSSTPPTMDWPFRRPYGHPPTTQQAHQSALVLDTSSRQLYSNHLAIPLQLQKSLLTSSPSPQEPHKSLHKNKHIDPSLPPSFTQLKHSQASAMPEWDSLATSHSSNSSRWLLQHTDSTEGVLPARDSESMHDPLDDGLQDGDAPIITKSLLIRIGIAVLVIAAIALLIWGLNLTQYMHPVLVWVKANPIPGLALLVSCIILLTVTSIPGVGILQVAIGFLYQPFPIALFFSFTAVNIGAVIATIIGKSFLRSAVERKIATNTKLRNAKIAIETDGPLITILLRCALPFSVGSYLFATIDSDPRAYLIGTIISGLLHAVPDTFIGTMLKDILDATAGSEDEDKRVKYIIFLVMGVFDVVIICFVAAFTSRAMRRVSDRQAQRKPSDPSQLDLALLDTPLVEESPRHRFSTFERRAMLAVAVLAVLCLSLGIPAIWVFLSK
ncbi:hypothetical protein BASA50_001254 [Batrachochytrium salamandrivorans]|uniref:VTT domain-containing protein n=1 Tax=Batrachochytrium salamandrivorans TaxID=1357716 RepID=A0ABQ8EVQ0_9FUNG|nr:hypothetical protein BASA62_004123 [Batrachochytrium salamandrivorans]KAH6574636.1 hypothetical protein BASA60_005401 [Batrachochytrium salamandrivorans]KAH6587325.1 hypothetical protein BASA50_001254 [Batrachochytrium salamandrivorans]KAH6588761.1 hypothetical protein BASA61_005825 [Batrachochytrium salamandrivorans]KAH9267276.1 hypothetical protein BASA83_010009 [Batrachochytrium salamandrivorans]